MGLRLAVTQGRDLRKVQVAAAVGPLVAGFALRALNKGLADRLPLPAFAIRSAVAYAGARALGEVGLRLGRGAAGRLRWSPLIRSVVRSRAHRPGSGERELGGTIR